MKFEITLNNLLFYAYHGVAPEERQNGNEFTVNLSVFIPCTERHECDNLAKTVSYADLFEIIKAEMECPRQLLETVAYKIGAEIKKKFEIVESGIIRIEKKRPPIPEMIGSAAVALHF